MKIKKALCCILSTVMLSAIPVSINAYAADTAENLYTLNELMKMSDEEFMALDGAENIYNNIMNVVKEDNEFLDGFECDDETQKADVKLNGEFKKIISLPSKDYIANLTEKKLAEILGNESDYNIISPLDSERLLYDNYLKVRFNEYDGALPTKENIVNMARCGYCVNQIIALPYESSHMMPETDMEDYAVTGDVNIDKNVDVLDVTWILKGLTNQFKLTDSQLAISDVNNDGIVNVFDAIVLSRKILKK